MVAFAGIAVSRRPSNIGLAKDSWSPACSRQLHEAERAEQLRPADKPSTFTSVKAISIKWIS
ncbi:hypothetical protein [Bradyrhizobium sp. JR3.5]